MFKDLCFLAFSFELACSLISVCVLWFVRVPHKPSGAQVLLKSSLPCSLILFTGVVLLSASLGSSDLTVMQNRLARITPEPGLVMDHPVAALGIVLIIAGATFRLAAIPLHLLFEEYLKELPCWLISLSGIGAVCVVAFFLLQFINAIAVVNLMYAEQILFFMGLIILGAAAGLLLIETDLKRILVLLVLQITGVFFAQLSAACWKWRHASSETEADSILDMMELSVPEYLFVLLALQGLACLLDSVGEQRSSAKYPEQIQGLISDQRILASVMLVLFLFLMGVPGFAAFQLKWNTMQTLLEIHQGATEGTMAVLHSGFAGLAVVLAISSAAVAFVCGKLIMQLCFLKPLSRCRELADRRIALTGYACVVGVLIFSLGRLVSL